MAKASENKEECKFSMITADEALKIHAQNPGSIKIRHSSEPLFVKLSDAAEEVAHLFTLEHLNKIVSDANAPLLIDSPSTREILLQERIAIYDREQNLIEKNLKTAGIFVKLDVSLENKKNQRLEESLSKDWQKFREHLTRLKEEQKILVEAEKTNTFVSNSDKDYSKKILSKLEVASSALDELYSFFCVAPKTRGQHGPMGLKNTPLAYTIFMLLPQAWKEVGVSSSRDKSARYRIVQKCLSLVGENVAEGTIRSAIEGYQKPRDKREKQHTVNV